MKKKDKHLNLAISGIKIALTAIVITLAAEALSIFLPSTKINPIIIGCIYLIMAGILFYYILKIPKQ